MVAANWGGRTRSIVPDCEGRLDQVVARRDCRHQVEPSVVEKTSNGRHSCLRPVDLDKQEMGLSPPRLGMGLGEGLRHPLVQLACRARDDIRFGRRPC